MTGNKGWIKLHRQIKDSRLFNEVDADHLKFGLWLLCSVVYEPVKVNIGHKELMLRAGQLLVTYSRLVNEFEGEFTVQNLRTMLKNLQRIGFIEVTVLKSSRKNVGQLITIRNFQRYQE